MGRFIITVKVGYTIIGYVESVSQKKGTISLTNQKGLAKKYTTDKACWTEISKIQSLFPLTYSVEQVY